MMQTDWMSMNLQDLRALPDLVRGKGIYFLWRGEELLYIGAATQAVDRVNRQGQIRDFGRFYEQMRYRNTPIIPFDKASIYRWEGRLIDMADAEKALIRRFRPPFNETDEHGDTRWGWHLAADEEMQK